MWILIFIAIFFNDLQKNLYTKKVIRKDFCAKIYSTVVGNYGYTNIMLYM